MFFFFKMYVHFKRDLLENQNYNLFQYSIVYCYLYLTSIPVNMLKLHPLTLHGNFHKKNLEMHCLNCDCEVANMYGHKYQYQYLGY